MVRNAGAAHQKALVANIASFSGTAPMARLASYSAAKAALIALSRAAQAEAGDLGIRVTALCPGYVDTPMSDFWSDQVPKGDMPGSTPSASTSVNTRIDAPAAEA
jgi:NAD(P)-dependent dehydrogenase (short-subunit alcohol dehydrogenase family)